MGFGKFLGCVVGGAVAIIAAPVVLPAAAAVAAGAAATAAGAAASAGVAIAGAAATASAAAAGAGAAVAGAASAATAAASAAVASAGAVAASTTVGTAVGSGLVAVGTTAGTVAGAVGLSSVATVAGTTAGATALGAITTAGTIGAATGISGAKKLSDAKEIIEGAEFRYNNKKDEYEKVSNDLNAIMFELAETKKRAWVSLNKYIEIRKRFEKAGIKGRVEFDEVKNYVIELGKIDGVKITIQDGFKGGIASAGLGTIAGLALGGGAISTVTTASTGTALAALHGAAATNATLAALGGGSLASGGLGMAGGAAVLSGVTMAPVLAVGGILLSFKGSSSLEKAKVAERKADKAIKSFNIAIDNLKNIKQSCVDILKQIKIILNNFINKVKFLDSVSKDKTSKFQFSDDEIKQFYKSELIAKTLYVITTQKIVEEKEGKTVLLVDKVKEVIGESKKNYKANS